MQRRSFLAGTAALGMSAGAGQAVGSIEGYWMPEESEPHARTFMQWPVHRRVHPDSVFLDMLQDAIANVANTISEFEPVVMLMAAQHEARARRKLGKQVEIWPIATDDLWCRDSGPVFVRNKAGNLAVMTLNFNGWGNKQPHRNDAAIAGKIAARLGLPLLDSRVVGEAGGLESDGHGTLIAHESSWVNPNRNRIGKAAIERRLLSAFGAQKMIWAPGVRGKDITDYHIDSLARFTRPGTVLIQMPEVARARDPWSKAAFETYDILAGARDARGQRLRLVELAEPTRTRVRSRNFVASYVNYYVCNGGVIAAQFGDRSADAAAKRALKKLYPGRQIVMLNVDPIGEVGGGIHCATQQQPKV